MNWVLDADIRRFFDAMSHEWLLRFLQHRIADKRLLRLIEKWLKVGIMDEHQVQRSDRGVPQGALWKAFHNEPGANSSTVVTRGVFSARDCRNRRTEE